MNPKQGVDTVADQRGSEVFLTGATGFVGKVVLEELLRRREEIGLHRVYLLIRPTKYESSPVARFKNELVPSPCFSNLDEDWPNYITVVSGELTQPGCGLGAEDKETITRNVSHIINCAASIEFDLPLPEAAAANITSSLNVLELGRACEKLKAFVGVSTAYVAPHISEDTIISESLIPLPRPAAEIYQSIEDGTAVPHELLAETGHPNTYTYTKCLAEHLLTERRGDVPLTIVRPSIVSATWQHPFPGWIDSHAAFAGFVALIGAGRLRAIAADSNTILDVMPCDEIAARVINAGFAPNPEPTTPRIILATAGKERGLKIGPCVDVITDYFKRHPFDRVPGVHYVGPRGMKLRMRELRHHRAPGFVAGTLLAVTGKQKTRRQVKRLVNRLDYLNQAFPYFTQNTFNFRSSVPFETKGFEVEDYVSTICQGVYRNLLKKDEREMPFAGRKHRPEKGDLSWTFSQPKGNWAIRSSAYLVRKTLRRFTEQVTFDRPSFEEAAEKVDPESLVVLIPTHRSYMDFVLCSYLFFAKPDMGIAIPRIAAADEFSRIPVLGWLFKQTYAFYIKRGLGREDRELTEKIQNLVEQRETLKFYIEGTRSRSRKFLQPRRGLLKAIHNTGQKCTVLPISITYDRVPEEEAFLRELGGGAKPKMRLRSLLAWATRVAVGRVDVGRVHMVCGEPQVMESTTDVYQFSRDVMTELQKNTFPTSHHLRCFIEKNPKLGLDVEWLKDQIERRGGRVVTSDLADEEKVDPMAERCMRYNWSYFFYPEVARLCPENPAIIQHLAQNSYIPPAVIEGADSDPRVQTLVRALFEPVCRDYATTAELLGNPSNSLIVTDPKEVVRRVPTSHLPNVEMAFEDLLERKIIVRDEEDSSLYWGPSAREVTHYRIQCLWPDKKRKITALG